MTQFLVRFIENWSHLFIHFHNSPSYRTRYRYFSGQTTIITFHPIQRRNFTNLKKTKKQRTEISYIGMSCIAPPSIFIKKNSPYIFYYQKKMINSPESFIAEFITLRAAPYSEKNNLGQFLVQTCTRGAQRLFLNTARRKQRRLVIHKSNDSFRESSKKKSQNIAIDSVYVQPLTPVTLTASQYSSKLHHRIVNFVLTQFRRRVTF